MVSLSELPPPSQDALTRLEKAVREALELPSPHVSIVGRGAIERGEDPYASMRGGVLVVRPGDEQFPHDTEGVRQLFQEVIHHAPGLRVVIIHGSRRGDMEPWKVSHKLVAGVEVDALRKQRRKVDKRVQAELKRLQADANADLSFGRFYEWSDVKVVHFDDAGHHSQPASPEFLEHFAEAVRIYQAAGFELTHAIWKLRGRRSRGTGFPGWEVEESFV